MKLVPTVLDHGEEYIAGAIANLNHPLQVGLDRFSLYEQRTFQLITCYYFITYNELSQKTRFQSVPIEALRLYNIQRENLVLKNLSVY